MFSTESKEQKIASASTEYPIFMMRENDYKKNQQESKKTLIKDFSLFKKTNDIRIFGGDAAIGVFRKQSSKSTAIKEYIAKLYLDFEEYFALEVLLQIGIYTPKARFAMTTDKDPTLYLMSKRVKEYMPMLYFLDPYSLNILYPDISSEYQIDYKNQRVIDTNGKSYKLVGVQGVYAGAYLVGDGDFQSIRNFGLCRVGNRFYGVAIDKNCVRFNAENFDELRERLGDDKNIKLYSSQLLDQKLAIIFQISKSMEVDKNGVCAFDKIFLDSRVIATKELGEIEKYKECCDNLKITARSMLLHYENELGKNYLKEFSQREEWRNMIAKQVMDHLQLDSRWLRLIVEDLRAPYYQEYFADQDKKMISEADIKNEKLLSALIKDIKNEITDYLTTEKKVDNKIKKRKEYERRDEEDNQRSVKRICSIC